jgi:glycosyltransferase involved in cell wall biosynthesis
MAQRLFDVAARRYYLLPPERFNKFNEEYAHESADWIICLGNQRVRNSYARFSRVININNAIFPIECHRYETKDFDTGRKHFLYFSGRGNVQKGLDLLIESFVGTDLHLHICQHMQNEFMDLYKKELTEEPNIHVHGFVKMRSQQFEDLVMRCNWLISATCAEGQPGAVLEGMAHGLIPILTDAANIDLDNLGIKMPSTRIEDIRSLIHYVSQTDTESCRSMADRVLKETRKTYSVENFRTSLKQAISQISATKFVREDRREGRQGYDSH